MANNTCAQPPELYQGDGSTTKYSFSFQYIKPADIAVFLWNNQTDKYDKCTLVDSNACTGQPTEYYFENSTPVELTFCVAPGLPPTNRPADFSNIIVGRETDICQMVAYFYPGTSIRAQDLNNDFTQVLLAIQDLPTQVLRLLAEATISVDQIEPLIREVDMDSPTVWDDTSLPTSGASKRYFENLYQTQQPTGRVEKGKIWWDPQQDGTTIVKIWTGSNWDPIKVYPAIRESDMDGPTVWDDTSVPTSGASKRYFENLYQVDPPDPNKRYERGKLWYQRYTTNLGKQFQNFSIYDGSTWQTITAGEVIPNPFTPQSILYVDPQGDDNNPGRRPDEAFRTIKRAVEVANTGTPGTVSSVSTAIYDNVGGFVNITTTDNHNLLSGTTVTLAPMLWSCTDGTAQFPGVSKQFRISSVTGPTTFRVYAGPNDKVHTYVSGGIVTPKDARLGDGYTVRCAPGVYAEKFPIQIQAKNLAIIGSSLRNTYVHPDITGESVAGQQQGVDIYPGELKTMFEMDSGSYLTGFTFAGLKSLGDRGNGGIDPDPTYGLPPQQSWVASHRQGSFITKSPYIQNCTHFSDLQTDNANFDPNFLAGEGGDTTSGPSGGGILVDGERVDASSPLRSFVVDSFTQISLGGPGVTCTNNGYAQLVSFFGTFCQYHAKSLNGGQLNLSNCTTDFGQYGLIADGKSAVPIFSAAVKADTQAGSQFIELISFTKGTQWEPPRQMTPLDHMVVEINGVLYPILGSNETADGYEINIFSPLADTVADPDAFENGGLKTDALQGNTCKFYLQSYISTGGHTMEFVGSGTDYRAHPDFGGIPEPANQTIEIGGVGDAGSRLSYINGGRVWLSSTDENGNFKVGETFTVNQKTGTIFILPEAIQSRFILREDLDLRGFKIIQNPSTSGANTDIQLQPSGTGDVVFGTDDVDADGNRITPAAILEPVLEHTTDDDRKWPVVTQRDLGYDADEVPVAGLLGKLAFTDSAPAVSSTVNPPQSNELTFSVSGTTLTISYQPTDGSAVKTTTLTLS